MESGAWGGGEVFVIFLPCPQFVPSSAKEGRAPIKKMHT